ncbi:hypothetical protein [Stappia sp. TSB10GB4]|uniref:hypothetical protein n=1 Tax=Stappia sp. TSB10GB4 TaxID=2003584 RepID=UPI0016482AB4|nr:hypothetical protein [Stappia sp. TSB10GB4]
MSMEPLRRATKTDSLRLIEHREMSADQLIQCGYDAMAIVSLCATVSRNLSDLDPGGALAGNVAIALDLAGELIAKLHDAVETHEELLDKAGERGRPQVAN